MESAAQQLCVPELQGEDIEARLLEEPDQNRDLRLAQLTDLVEGHVDEAIEGGGRRHQPDGSVFVPPDRLRRPAPHDLREG